MSVKTAAIVGAGVAGLAAALALGRHGIRCDIAEQAQRLTEVGAGLQISPNASRILAELGVLAELETVWREPERIDLISGISLKSLASVACGDFARKRWGAPYGVLHRATLQQALLAAVERHPLCRLHLGCRIEPADTETISALSGGRPDLLVVANGVWSKLRTLVPESPAARFSGNIAWRFVLPESDAPAFVDHANVTACLGPSSHLVCYPLKETGGFNVVAITAGADPGETWQAMETTSHRALLQRRFSEWNPAIRHLLEQAGHPTFWPLCETGAGRWHNGRDTVLIGDAAHAMMPFAAQGAAMAIEDACELAAFVASMPIAEALDVYERQRQPRIAHLRKRAAFNKFVYHARGPLRLGRDMLLSLRPPQALAADLDWIYGYQAKI